MPKISLHMWPFLVLLSNLAMYLWFNHPFPFVYNFDRIIRNCSVKKVNRSKLICIFLNWHRKRNWFLKHTLLSFKSLTSAKPYSWYSSLRGLLDFLQVTITRRIGDELHTIRRRKDSSGNEETEEDTANVNSGKHLCANKWLLPLSVQEALIVLQ